MIYNALSSNRPTDDGQDNYSVSWLEIEARMCICAYAANPAGVLASSPMTLQSLLDVESHRVRCSKSAPAWALFSTSCLPSPPSFVVHTVARGTLHTRSETLEDNVYLHYYKPRQRQPAQASPHLTADSLQQPRSSHPWSSAPSPSPVLSGCRTQPLRCGAVHTRSVVGKEDIGSVQCVSTSIMFGRTAKDLRPAPSARPESSPQIILEVQPGEIGAMMPPISDLLLSRSRLLSSSTRLNSPPVHTSVKHHGLSRRSSEIYRGHGPSLRHRKAYILRRIAQLGKCYFQCRQRVCSRMNMRLDSSASS